MGSYLITRFSLKRIALVRFSWKLGIISLYSHTIIILVLFNVRVDRLFRSVINMSHRVPLKDLQTWSQLLAPPVLLELFASSSSVNRQNFLKFLYVIISCMPQLLNAPACVKQLMNLTNEENCENICVFRMAG